MIRGIHHTAISTGDLQRALAFYRDLLGFETVFEAGWPAQNIRPGSAVNRVHVALTALRNLGLREVLQSSPDGYRFDPETPLQIVAELDLD